MSTHTALQSPTLEEVSEHFRKWRQTRIKKEPYPKDLLQKAISLVGIHPKNQICKKLSLNPSRLNASLKRFASLSPQNKKDRPNISEAPFMMFQLPLSSGAHNSRALSPQRIDPPPLRRREAVGLSHPNAP